MVKLQLVYMFGKRFEKAKLLYFKLKRIAANFASPCFAWGQATDKSRLMLRFDSTQAINYRLHP